MFVNKKGIGIDDTIAFIIFIFIAAIGIFFFRFNENVKSAGIVEDIKLQKDTLYVHQVLIEYLSKIDEQGNNKADFISKSVIEKDYEKLKKDMKEYFDIKLAPYSIWYIDLIDSSHKSLFSLQNDAYSSASEQYKDTQFVSVFIPVYNTAPGYIQIQLFYGR